jgi:hypothetical protein
VGCRYQARVYSNPQKERIVDILSTLCVNKQVSAPQPLVWIMKYERVGVPNFDQYPCEKLKGIPHSVAHARLALRTVMEQTPKGMQKYPENNV